MRVYDFIGEELNIGDYVIYLKNTRTGSSTIRKCKYVGVIVGFTEKSVRIAPMSRPDRFEFYGGIEDKDVLIDSSDIVCKRKDIWEVSVKDLDNVLLRIDNIQFNNSKS